MAERISVQTVETQSLSNSEREELNRIIAAGFGRDPYGMQEDTNAHIDSSEYTQIALCGEQRVGIAMYATKKLACDALRIMELSGIVIHPAYQGHRIGTAMMQSAIIDLNPNSITAFTRNPAVYELIDRVTDRIEVPQDALANHVLSVYNNLTLINGAAYHQDRFAVAGLYGGDDPAKHARRAAEVPFVEEFPGLINPRTALFIHGTRKEGER